MRRFLVAGFATVSLLAQAPSPQAGADDAQAWQSHRSLRVLYAGWPGGARERAFADFLHRWFDKVGVIDLATLSMQTAADYDVVIADWCSQYGNDGYPKRDNSLFSAPVALGPEFSKPLIAMDYVSSQVRSQYKLDWL